MIHNITPIIGDTWFIQFLFLATPYHTCLYLPIVQTGEVNIKIMNVYFLLSFSKQLKSGNTITVMTIYDEIPVKSTKAEQQNQHGIINVEAIRYDGQNSHRAHNLTEEKDTINKYNSIYFSYYTFYTDSSQCLCMLNNNRHKMFQCFPVKPTEI